MTNTFVLLAQAKINLRLRVTGRKEDGYHLLSMINATCDLADTVELTINDSGKVETHSDLDLGDPSKNLATIAAEQYFKRAELPNGATIKIIKKIPVGGGLGGGSSDAASVLRKLVEVYGDYPFVKTLALELGADVPYLMHGGLAIVEGVGEKITPISCEELSGWPCLLVNPNYGVNTKQAFQDLNWGQKVKPDCKIKNVLSTQELFDLIENDFLTFNSEFQKKVFAVAEKSGMIAGLSGSGSTMFILPREKSSNIDIVAKELAKLTGVRLFETSLI